MESGSVKTRMAFVAVLLALPATTAVSAERYDCFNVTGDSSGAYQANRDETVELTVDGATIRSRIHIDAATKDLTFATCSPVKADASSFSRWFATECRTLGSADGSPYTVDAFLADAYVGISPPIDATYEMQSALAEIGAKIGTGTPQRTFVIYADREPQYEFFCYGGKAGDKP